MAGRIFAFYDRMKLCTLFAHGRGIGFLRLLCVAAVSVEDIRASRDGQQQQRRAEEDAEDAFPCAGSPAGGGGRDVIG